MDLKNLKALKIVINSGNGAAGPVIDALHSRLKTNGVKTDFVFVYHNPDKNFPNGIPNPLLEENRPATADVVLREKADFGVAFDGDFDRCFLFDHLGNFIPGEYVVGLLAGVFLGKYEGATIIHDPRTIWNTVDIVKKYGGTAVMSKSGHSFLKESMRKSRAVYGGEISAHHYFRDFFYCDSGMIPWLLIWELLSQKNNSLASLISERKKKFLSSGEMNFRVNDADECIKIIKSTYANRALSIHEMDGLSICFENWRFNLRKSNTEALVRLNIETTSGKQLLTKETEKLSFLISGT